MGVSAVPPRSAIAVEHTWDAASIFPNDDAWEAAFRGIVDGLPALEAFRGRLGDGAGTLADWLEAMQAAFRTLWQVVAYATMGHSVDKTDQAASARHDRARGLLARVTAKVAFAEPEIIALGFDNLRRWIAEEPRLAIYAHYVDRLARRAPHVRSPEVEELLGFVADPFRAAAATHGILADADLVFPPARTSAGEPVEVAQGNLRVLLSHEDREVRRTAWEGYADAHLAHRHAMANCLSAGVKQAVFMARARRYGSALEASLLANDIPVDVFHNLIATFRRHLPTWHRYWGVRRRALGYERLGVYDERAPLGAQEPRVTFPQAVEWIAQGLAPLGDEYVSTLRRGTLEQRWVDLYPNRGKQSGAFSMGAPGTHPFILMSYSDDIYSASTLAHELGHSMHSHFAWRTQPLIYARYPLFLAEVASNFNQAMLRAYLLATQSDPGFQIAVIEEAMANFHRYFFIMPTLARFELEIHERVERGGALTSQDLTALMADLFREAYGDEVEIDADRVGVTWATFHTHLYISFYVFQYATGIAAAHALAGDVLSGVPGASERYLEFLSAGGSRYPLDALKKAGVDMVSPEPVERAFGTLSQMVDRLEGCLTQMKANSRG
ncbi:MAG: oligoendopeptidase F [Armatimonadetes bacterium]|nr:oligoendopeptidase F [Armatimonadota bacterium]